MVWTAFIAAALGADIYQAELADGSLAEEPLDEPARDDDDSGVPF